MSDERIPKVIGQIGWIKPYTDKLWFKVLSVNQVKRCPRCGGRWGTMVLLKSGMLSSSQIAVVNTEVESCIADLKELRTPDYDKQTGRIILPD